MARSLLGLGSNLGPREQTLDAALVALASAPRVTLVAHSHWRETKPVGGPPGQGAYLNGAALVETTLSPRQLLALLHEIERQAGRTRDQRWSARTLDLDLLLYDEQVLVEPGLVVPHPRLAVRRFVLEPACEIGPDMRHPTSALTLAELLAAISRRPRWMALIADRPGVAVSLGKALADRMAAPLVRSIASPNGPCELGKALEAAGEGWVVAALEPGESNTAEAQRTTGPLPGPSLIVELSASTQGKPAMHPPLFDLLGLRAPVLRLDAMPLEQQLAELEAALAAMD